MLVRAIALAIAAITGTVGVLPSLGGHRCLTMGERMAPQHECCPDRGEAPTSVGAPCCESIAAIARDTSATTAAPDPGVTRAVVVGLLPFAALRDGAQSASERLLCAYPRGRPPGDRLRSLSSILRV